MISLVATRGTSMPLNVQHSILRLLRPANHLLKTIVLYVRHSGGPWISTTALGLSSTFTCI